MNDAYCIHRYADMLNQIHPKQHPTWYKVLMAIELLESYQDNPNIGWIFWVDAGQFCQDTADDSLLYMHRTLLRFYSALYHTLLRFYSALYHSLVVTTHNDVLALILLLT